MLPLEVVDIIINDLSNPTKRLLARRYFTPFDKCDFKLRDHKNSLWYDVGKWNSDSSYWCLLISKEEINYISNGYIKEYKSDKNFIIIEEIRLNLKFYLYYIKNIGWRNAIGLKNILSEAQSLDLLLNFS